jgi:hypothetical protein
MRFALLAATALAILPTVTLAQTASQPAASAQPGHSTAPSANAGGREMSPEARARFEAFRAACGADLKAHCGEIQRGTDEGRAAMRQCVETHKVKFSATCQTAITARDSAREARKQNQPTPAAEKPKS